MTLALNNLQFAAVLVSIIAGLVAIHKFAIKRPNLKLLVLPWGNIDENGQGIITFAITNSGHKMAEDVFVNLRFEDWTLDSEMENTTDVLFPATNDISTWIEKPSPGIRELIESHSNIDHQKHHIYLKHPVHQGTEMEFATRLLRLETDQKYTFDYLIGYRGSRLTGGSVDIYVDENGNMRADENHWGTFKRLRYWIESFHPNSL